MKQLTRSDILDKDDYERIRPDFRRRVLMLKDERRVPVGAHCTIHFENREAMQYQVQETLRAEDNWLIENAIDEELSACNALIPVSNELSATLMLEYDTPQERAQMLPRFVGLEQHVRILIGDAHASLAVFDRAQTDEHKVSSVQYIRFPLSEEQCRLLNSDGTVVRLVIDHPAYEAQAVLSDETRRSIGRDLGN